MKMLRLTMILAAAIPLFAQSDVTLQRAIRKETVEGDLKGAIELYRKAAAEAGKDRTTGAQALLHLAQCYEKQGNAEARATYERVVREYGDQQASVGVARARLAVLTPVTLSRVAMSTRKVWEKPGINGTVSPDGRYVSITDWTEGGDLAIRDVVAGVDRRLTGREDTAGSYADGSVISPDGKRVAYLWAKVPPDGGRNWEFQARIVSIEGKSSPQIFYRSPRYFFVSAWTPDGKSLVLQRSMEGETWQIALLALEDGSLRQLKSLKWDIGGISVSPDGRYLAYDVPSDEDPARDIFVLATDGSQEHVLVRHPANDRSTIWTPDGSRILFVSDRTTTPSLWSIPVKDGRPIGEAELVQANTGEIQPKGITPSGSLYYKIGARSFRNVYRALLGDDGKVAGRPHVIGEQSVNTNWGASLSPDGSELAFYSLRPRQSLVIRNVKTGQERVFPIDVGSISGPFFDGPQWFSDGQSVLVNLSQQQRPCCTLYRVDTASGRASVFPIGDTREDRALYRISRDGKSIFYRADAGRQLVRFNLETQQQIVLLPTAAGTKDRVSDIAVSPDGTQVAYRTERQGGHVFKVISASGGEPREVFQFPAQETGGGERYNALSWTPDKRYLLFVKRNEKGAACTFETSRTCMSSLWRIDLARGEAGQAGGEMRVSMKGPQMHPDGKSIFLSGSGIDDELWVLENFLATQRAGK